MKKLATIAFLAGISLFSCKNEGTLEKNKFYPIAVGRDSMHYFYLNSTETGENFYKKNNSKVYTLLTSEEEKELKQFFGIEKSNFDKYIIKK